MKLIFMGTPEFSVPALEALVAAGHTIIAAYSQPPRPSGRGHSVQKSPVHLAAEAHGITVFTPATLKTSEAQTEFAALHADVAIVVAYGLILPKPILEACRCINIHASLLPRWRGAAPIQRAIEAGDSQTGITTMNMDVGLDTGDMLLWESVPIHSHTTGGQLHDTLSQLGADLIVKTLADLHSITPIKQPEEGVTYAAKITKEEAHLDWNHSSEQIQHKIQAFNPYPGAYVMVKGEKVKILTATQQPDKHTHTPGSIIDDSFAIACKNGIIQPLIVQRQGKKPMEAAELLRGFPIPQGEVLS